MNESLEKSEKQGRDRLSLRKYIYWSLRVDNDLMSHHSINQTHNKTVAIDSIRNKLQWYQNNDTYVITLTCHNYAFAIHLMQTSHLCDDVASVSSIC